MSSNPPTPAFLNIVNADTLGPAGFTVWFEVLADFARAIRTAGANADEQMLLAAIENEADPYIDALMGLLAVCDHDQLHAQMDATGPHAIIEHFLRDITGEPEAPSRAQIVLEMHAQLADARDALKREWDAV